jgi:hypothetical protein
MDALRNAKVVYYAQEVLQAGSAGKEMTSFKELHKIDRLKFIKLYYNAAMLEDKIPNVFPSDSTSGFPCISNPPTETALRETQELGAMEIFYIGYLIERDGPINALSTFLEVKTQALRQNIGFQMDKIEALNQCLIFVNRTMSLYSSSQSSGEKKNRVPFAVVNGCVLLVSGVLRSLKTLVIDGEERKYMVLQGTEYIDTSRRGYELTTVDKYLLVEASTLALDKFFGTKVNGSGDSTDTDGMVGQWGYWFGNYVGAHPDLIPAQGRNITTQYGASVLVEDNQYEIFNGFQITDTGDYDRVVTDCRNSAQNDKRILVVDFSLSANPKEAAKNWLPKDLGVDKITRVTQVARESMTVKVQELWQTTFNNKAQFINNRIDSINNEVVTLRSKIDAFDTASTSFRNRARDVYSGIIGNIRG